MNNYWQPNAYKISNPPGGRSSIQLGWDQPESKEPKITNRNRSIQNVKNNQVKNYQMARNPKQNFSLSQQPVYLQNLNRNNIYQNENINQNKLSQNPIFNNIKPLSYSKKPYQQYLNPNFVQPRRMQMISNQKSIHNWQVSSRFLQDQLRYYQQKNRLLKQKIHGGYNNDEALRKFQGDYHPSVRGRMNTYDQPQQLDLALRQRQKNIHGINNFEMENRYYSLPKANQFYQQSHGLFANSSMIMQNNSQVKTSVKVHGPPGGKSSIKLG